MKQLLRLLTVLVMIASAAHTGFGQRTIRMNIERIVTDAAIIVHGTVNAVVSRTDEQTGLIATFVTIDVTEDLYGAGQKSITLKMLGGRTAKRTLKLSDMPQYVPGQEIIGMFFKPSKSGFTSPVGMGQGTFTVQKDAATGARFIERSPEHRALFSDMKHLPSLARREWTAQQEQRLDAAEFTTTLRSLITDLKR